jgi:5-enolpyruvylshikimate-3-phosphate synthase
MEICQKEDEYSVQLLKKLKDKGFDKIAMMATELRSYLITMKLKKGDNVLIISGKDKRQNC